MFPEFVFVGSVFMGEGVSVTQRPVGSVYGEQVFVCVMFKPCVRVRGSKHLFQADSGLCCQHSELSTIQDSVAQRKALHVVTAN